MRCDPEQQSEQFIAMVKPALSEHDAEALAALVKSHYTIEQLCRLLASGTLDARKVVCLTLGMVGCNGCVSCLAHALHDGDSVVAELAEHAMWSIWFRGGSDEAMGHFKAGLRAMDQQDEDQAIEALTQATAVDPTFAEAFHQRAIAHDMLEQWEEAMADCQRVIDLTPLHFGAVAEMGHCFAHLGDLAQAADCYRDALAINPRMYAIAGALANIEQGVKVAVG